jgi:uncharacterized membrane protein
MRRYWVRTAVALPAATIAFLISSAPAVADLKLCNRMSYVVEVAIGIDDKAATATRGWSASIPQPAASWRRAR